MLKPDDDDDGGDDDDDVWSHCFPDPVLPPEKSIFTSPVGGWWQGWGEENDI